MFHGEIVAAKGEQRRAMPWWRAILIVCMRRCPRVPVGSRPRRGHGATSEHRAASMDVPGAFAHPTR